MEEIVRDIMREYKKKGYINFYIVGVEGVGKTIFTHQLLALICRELNISPKVDMLDLNNDIASINGINLIETYKNSSYKFKVEVLNLKNKKGFYERGFYRYKEIMHKFKDKNIFNEKLLIEIRKQLKEVSNK